MHNLQFYVSGKRPIIGYEYILRDSFKYQLESKYTPVNTMVIISLSFPPRNQIDELAHNRGNSRIYEYRSDKMKNLFLINP